MPQPKGSVPPRVALAAAWVGLDVAETLSDAVSFGLSDGGSVPSGARGRQPHYEHGGCLGDPIGKIKSRVPPRVR
jgi:hypothetical protein